MTTATDCHSITAFNTATNVSATDLETTMNDKINDDDNGVNNSLSSYSTTSMLLSSPSSSSSSSLLLSSDCCTTPESNDKNTVEIQSLKGDDDEEAEWSPRNNDDSTNDDAIESVSDCSTTPPTESKENTTVEIQPIKLDEDEAVLCNNDDTSNDDTMESSLTEHVQPSLKDITNTKESKDTAYPMKERLSNSHNDDCDARKDTFEEKRKKTPTNTPSDSKIKLSNTKKRNDTHADVWALLNYSKQRLSSCPPPPSSPTRTPAIQKTTTNTDDDDDEDDLSYGDEEDVSIDSCNDKLTVEVEALKLDCQHTNPTIMDNDKEAKTHDKEIKKKKGFRKLFGSKPKQQVKEVNEEGIHLSQKQLQQSVKLAEEAARTGIHQFTTKNYLSVLDKVQLSQKTTNGSRRRRRGGNDGRWKKNSTKSSTKKTDKKSIVGKAKDFLKDIKKTCDYVDSATT